MAWYNPASWLEPVGRTLFGGVDALTGEPEGAKKLREEGAMRRQKRDMQGRLPASFARDNELAFAAQQARNVRDQEMLRRRARGADSLSAEQLRQGLQQIGAQQRSFAASAAPGNAAM